jgi:hypothetical protein
MIPLRGASADAPVSASGGTETALSSTPTESAPSARAHPRAHPGASSPADAALDELLRLWPDLDPSARAALLAVARVSIGRAPS